MDKNQTSWWNRFINSPFLWGGCLTVAFYYAIFKKVVEAPWIERYFAGHWVEYAQMALFFIGGLMQLFALIGASQQRRITKQVKLDPIPADGQPVSDAEALAKKLSATPVAQRGWMYWRLHSALDFVQRSRAANMLTEELKHLADTDFERRGNSHALTKVIIWAIPILGFLGTVLGLTEAVSNLSADAEALKQSVGAVTAGLGTAFDATGLGLVLSMVMMFGQWAVDKSELTMLAEVDERTRHEFDGRFHIADGQVDPVVARVHGIAESVLDATAEIVARQADLWKASLDEGRQQWDESGGRQQKMLEAAMQSAVTDSLRMHAEMVAETERRFAQEQHQALARITDALRQTVEAVGRQQHELTRQGEILLQVVEATGQVARLEEALNRNLSKLASTGQFEDTLHSLSAAIHLLTAKLGSDDSSGGKRSISLPKSRTEGNAA